MKNVTKEMYLNNPCGSLPYAFWKRIEYPIPENVATLGENDCEDSANTTKYFRLIHHLEKTLPFAHDDFMLETVDIETQTKLVAEILSECYNAEYTADFVAQLTKTRVFDNDLWLLIIEKSTRKPAALGIADLDPEIKEGSLEWIQVLPSKRGLGLGTLLVNELLSRLKTKADFVTVSGQVDNKTKPEMLYRKCGFTGNDIWCFSTAHE